MSKNIAVIQNQLLFMLEQYMKSKVLLNEYANTKIFIVLKKELPHKIFLTLESLYVNLLLINSMIINLKKWWAINY